MKNKNTGKTASVFLFSAMVLAMKGTLAEIIEKLPLVLQRKLKVTMASLSAVGTKVRTSLVTTAASSKGKVQ